MRHSKGWKWICSMALFLIIFSLGISFMVDHKGAKDIVKAQDITRHYNAILVLGAGVYEDGRPTPMLRERLDQGLELYHQGVAPKLLLSGDHGRRSYDEVNAMKQYMLDLGVPQEDLFLDHAGLNTYASMVRAKEVFQCESIVIVTQRYHLSRALYMAKKIGLDAKGVSCDTKQYPGQFMRTLREIGARNKAVWVILWRPDPVLGSPMDIRGDGTMTFDEK